jgi:hypothetical protein
MIETQPTTASTKGLPPGALLRPLAKIQGLPKGAVLRVLQGKTESATVSRGTEPIGATEPDTGRPVLQASPRAEENQAAATAEHPDVKARITEAVKGIKGAQLAGSRPEKDEARLEEKIDEEGQSPRTVRDYSGFRISVDSPAAHQQAAAALRKHFEVPDEQDEFDQGSAETGFHGHTLQVRDQSSPVTHEVQILPREVAEHADSRHDLYEKTRDGDKDAAAELKKANDADWRSFQVRNGTATKYRYGTTQANIPAGSQAAKALDKFRKSIPDADLAGDGKDVGAGGNGNQKEVALEGGDAVRERSAGGVLQREPGEAGKAGSGRRRVEPGQQGSLFAGAQSDAGQVQRDDAKSPKQKFKQLTNARKQSAKGEDENPNAWIGFDLDKTLARYDKWDGPAAIGEPLGVDEPDSAFNHLKQALADGKNVRILTARVADDPKGEARAAIEAWSRKHFGQAVPITDRKDHDMEKLYDDRAVPVEANTGKVLA